MKQDNLIGISISHQRTDSDLLGLMVQILLNTCRALFLLISSYSNTAYVSFSLQPFRIPQMKEISPSHTCNQSGSKVGVPDVPPNALPAFKHFTASLKPGKTSQLGEGRRIPLHPRTPLPAPTGTGARLAPASPRGGGLYSRCLLFDLQRCYLPLFVELVIEGAHDVGRERREVLLGVHGDRWRGATEPRSWQLRSPAANPVVPGPREAAAPRCPRRGLMDLGVPGLPGPHTPRCHAPPCLRTLARSPPPRTCP